ncbi:unnamed protein product [Euphydryas editha]|uniref:Uncharacterized protein n=1 Tax=Euphydryas editha TaxID=104508 RepID=A0AAU9TRP6_EUPED|nr:unnamed protein product [Euphydryas editha]
MDTVYPAAASVLARGRRRRRVEPRQRHRTMPVTFAEIKEVDEEKEVNEEVCGASVASVASAIEERRRRPDLLEERLGREFAEFRRRRARRDHLREADEPAVSTSPPGASGSQSAPCNSCVPCVPCAPCAPCAPCVPCAPCAPCAPGTPCVPCAPCAPCAPGAASGSPPVSRAASEPRPEAEPS